VVGGKVEDLLRGRRAQAGTPLPTAVPVLRHPGPVAPLGDQTADREAPVGLEMLHHRVGARHLWEVVDPMRQRRGTIGAGARLAQRPDDLTRGDHQRGDHGAHPRPDVLGLAVCRLARSHGRCGGLALEHLPAGLFITAQHHTVRRKEAPGVEGEGPPGGRFGLAVRGVAVEPRDAPGGLEGRLIQKAPAPRTTHRPGAPLRQGGDPVVETPARGCAVVPGRCTGCHRQPIQTGCGGKSAAADPAAAPLAGH
jgi:hypothetical protein